MHNVQQLTALQTLCYEIERNGGQQHPVYRITYHCLVVFSLTIIQMKRGD